MHGRHELLDVDSIELDRENPRIALVFDLYNRPLTANDISLALSDYGGTQTSETTLDVLRDSIRATGTITQPIIVNHTNGKYVVIEGNTRLMIYKDFKKKGVKGDWSKIPCLVYDDMDEETKHSVRLQSHIVGPRQWNPYSKAKYLKKLRDEECLSTSRIIELCGGKKSEIQELIEAYDDMEEYYRKIAGNRFDTKQFSAFRELNASKKRVYALTANGFTKADFGRWVLEGKIGEATNVRRIADVLNDERLKEIFLKHDLKTAISKIPANNQMPDADLKTILDMTLSKIGDLKWIEVVSMKDGTMQDERDSLLSLYDALGGIVDQLKS